VKLLTAVVVAAVCLGVGSAAVGKSKRSRKHHRHEKRSKHHRPPDPLAEGRSHLKKANALAGEGDCEAAIDEYTAAYEKLEDPVVLFNRGECYRRTGASEKAVADYRAFLDKVPQARNRADIEAKISSLSAAAVVAPSQPPAPRSPPASRPQPAPRQEPPVSPPAATPPVVAAPAPPAAAPVEEPAAPVVVRKPVEAAGAPAEAGIRWWTWAALAVLVAGGAAAGVVMFWPKESAPPDSTWGNYRF
jgi:hypothetical protein